MRDVGQTFVWLDVESQAFDRVVDETKDSSGFWYTPDFVFDAKGLRSSTCFVLGCRELVWETEADREYNHTSLRETAWVRTGDGTGYKLLRRLAVSRSSIGPMEVGNIGEWTEEWVVRTQSAELMMSELQGLSTQPLYDGERRQFHTALVQLATSELMPLSVKDLTVTATDADEPGMKLFRSLGCLVYERASMVDTDFARTSEGWGAGPSYCQVLWIGHS